MRNSVERIEKEVSVAVEVERKENIRSKSGFLPKHRSRYLTRIE